LRLDRIRFGFERLLLRGLRYRLLLAASIVAAVALLAGGLVVLSDAGFSGLGEAVWWAFLRLTDPGYLGDDEGVVRRSVSTAVTVLGYVLFLGLLIAILTQWLGELISKLESGVTPVALSDHVVLLGWTHRTPTIVSELLHTRGRAKRFLARRGARELRIVILAEHVDAALARELRERIGTPWNDRQVMLRSGTPLRSDHLERVAFRSAAVLILPGADHAERNPDAVDAQTVKTLMAVSRHAGQSGTAPPLAVAELHDGRKADVARRAYAGDSEILPADDIISRLVAQSVRQRGLCSVFTELVTLNRGNALHIRQNQSQSGVRFGELRGAFPRAIPLGMLRAGGQGLDLNPDPETIVEPDDLLVFIARSFEGCTPGASPRAVAAAPPISVRSRPALENRRLLILGWSRKVPALLREFGRYGGDAFEIDVVSSTPVEAREEALERCASEAPAGSVRQIEASYTTTGVLERLEPQGYDNIVLLASERLEEAEQADATTVFTYLSLRALLPEHGRRPELFVELLDEENQFLFQQDREDVMVSPLAVSYLLSQVSLRRELAAVFQELSQPWGAQIVLHSAREYLDTDGPSSFEELDSAAAARGEIALGMRCLHGPHAGLALNPDRDAEWRLAPDDEVVVLTSYPDPSSR
jgi:hypothetical protein